MSVLSKVSRFLDSFLWHKGRRRTPYHFIVPRRQAWIPWTFIMLFSLNATAASLNWSVSGITNPLGLPSNIGKAWLILGQDPSPTVAAILAGTFTSGGKSVTGGTASGKLTVARGSATIYNYLVILEPNARYYISPIRANVAGDTVTFTSPVGWVTIPEPSTLVLLAIGMGLVLARPGRA